MTSTGHLPQILIKNAFNILGLPSTSILREIRKRSQQLIQLAKIEEIQEFETDIGSVKEFRKENEIRLALERTSGIKERLKEIFFWFEDYSVESRKVLTLISKGNYQQAVDSLEETERAGFNWLDKKNLALALMFHAFASSDLDSFRRSLCFWKQIVESDEFWKFYEKHYLLHDELGTVTSLFEEFRNSIYETISATTVSFYHQTKYPEVIGACYLAFNRIGHAIDSDILQPIILKVKKELEFLERMPDYSSEPSVSLAKESIQNICDNFLELDEFEVSEYSPLIILRNDTAETLRSISIDIYNDFSNVELTEFFLNRCMELAHSESILEKIEDDKRQLVANEAYPLANRTHIESSEKEEKGSGWIGWVICIGFILLKSCWGDISATSSKTVSPSYSLTKEEKEVISYLQKNNPKFLKEVRMEGYSDKEIAQYVLNLSEENEG